MITATYDPLDIGAADAEASGCATHASPSCLCDVDLSLRPRCPDTAIEGPPDGVPLLDWLTQRLVDAERPALDERGRAIISTADGVRFVRLWSEGWSLADIAEALDLDKSTLSRWRKALGLPERNAWTDRYDDWRGLARQLWESGQFATRRAVWLHLRERGCTANERSVRRWMEP